MSARLSSLTPELFATLPRSLWDSALDAARLQRRQTLWDQLEEMSLHEAVVLRPLPCTNPLQARLAWIIPCPTLEFVCAVTLTSGFALPARWSSRLLLFASQESVVQMHALRESGQTTVHRCEDGRYERRSYQRGELGRALPPWVPAPPQD